MNNTSGKPIRKRIHIPKLAVIILLLILSCVVCSCGRAGNNSPESEKSVSDPGGISQSETRGGDENESEEDTPSADDNELPIITNPNLK